MIAKKVNYKGKVQGVGFRWRANRLAREFEVTGYVANREDGSVELLAQGEDDQVQEFLDSVSHAMAEEISSQDVETVSPGEFDSFSIRR